MPGFYVGVLVLTQQALYLLNLLLSLGLDLWSSRLSLPSATIVGMCHPCSTLFLLFIFQCRFMICCFAQWFACVCVFECSRVCARACVHKLWTCACIVWRLEVNIRCIPPLLVNLPFEMWYLIESEEHTLASQEWLGCKLQGPSCLSNTRILGTCLHAQFCHVDAWDLNSAPHACKQTFYQMRCLSRCT